MNETLTTVSLVLKSWDSGPMNVNHFCSKWCTVINWFCNNLNLRPLDWMAQVLSSDKAGHAFWDSTKTTSNILLLIHFHSKSMHFIEHLNTQVCDRDCLFVILVCRILLHTNGF